MHFSPRHKHETAVIKDILTISEPGGIEASLGTLLPSVL